MKKLLAGILLCCLGITVSGQSATNTLLWRISGKNLTKPSYLFGTIHLLCADDIILSDSLKRAIQKSDKVYLELDMDNVFEMLSVVNKMKMRNDTTLADLLTPAEYEKVKDFFTKQNSVLPFSMLEKYKPLLTASTIMQSSMACDNAVAMEQLIMREAKKQGKGIKGLETMAYQISIFDSIPYKVQAKQLLSYVENYNKKEDSEEFKELTDAYRKQQLSKLEELSIKEEAGFENFTNLLLYNRNINWVKKLQDLMTGNALVIAVGAGHLPGEKGVINLLRKAGYKVDPVDNKMIKTADLREM
ncbi:MAG: TraB/GumN family protein [Flavisolibacter sp.]|nr:TraB/GumN family protein [Flavisolibacter sp.]MBD0295941.1 TraB/GumN family protein [Flavisolibacter sp.]